MIIHSYDLSKYVIWAVQINNKLETSKLLFSSHAFTLITVVFYIQRHNVEVNTESLSFKWIEIWKILQTFSFPK